MTFPRITVEADKMGGQPCIRGLRIPVATVVAMIADGMTVDEILTTFPTWKPKTSPRRSATQQRRYGNVSYQYVSQCEVSGRREPISTVT